MVVIQGSVFLEKHFDNNLHNDVLFACSESGYSNEKLGFEYLKHFERQTKARTVGKYRMLIFDGHGSHLTDEFLIYAWQNNIIPFLFPSYTTHLLQPLDIGIFQPLKHWHQEDIFNKIQYGNISYDKVDFLNGFQKIRNNTFKSRSILSAWHKAGLFPFNPEIVYSKLKEFEAEKVAKEAQVLSPLIPRTPSPKPFQQPPITCNRSAHSKYLDQRIIDHCDYDKPLTPSFKRSWQVYQEVTKPKILQATLIQERETVRLEQEREDKRRKAGSNKWVQQHGIIYKGVGIRQVIERKQEEDNQKQHVKNMKLVRIVKKQEVFWNKYLLKDISKYQESKINEWTRYKEQYQDLVIRLKVWWLMSRRLEELTGETSIQERHKRFDQAIQDAQKFRR
jgi:hypothetical protein